MNICRICMKDKSDLSSIFAAQSDGLIIASMIMALSNIEINENDGLPEIICQKCSTDVGKAYKLREVCRESDKKLRELLDEQSEKDYEECEVVKLEDEEEFESEIYAEDLQEIVKLDDQAVEKGAKETEKLPQTKVKKKIVKEEIARTDFKCCGCDLSFGNQELLVEHSKVEHLPMKPKDDQKPLECNICYKRFLTAKGLKHHQENVYLVKMHQCFFCGRKFETRAILEAHERFHRNERPYICDVCNRGFTSRANLSTHVTTHLPLEEHKKFVCNICGNRFSRRSYFKLHMNLHSDETPFKCKMCPSSFKSKQNLKLHWRIHSGEKPYSCSYCDRKFTYPTDKKRHEMSHTGEKPWKCETCNKAFTRKNHLQKHCRVHFKIIENAENSIETKKMKFK